MSETPDLPQPQPELKRLDRFVGSWTMEANLVGSDEKNIRGETTFRWLEGGFFPEQRVDAPVQSRVSSITQFGSKLRPSSKENDCSQTADEGVMSFQS
jgi:hypothetical protein